MDYPLRLPEQLKAHLRALRKQRGLTQAQLGQRLGLGQARMAEIEAKPGLVSVEQFMKLLSVLGATLVLRDDSSAGAVQPEPAGSFGTPVAAKGAKRPPAPAARKRGKKEAGTDKAGTEASPLSIRPKKGSW